MLLYYYFRYNGGKSATIEKNGSYGLTASYSQLIMFSPKFLQNGTTDDSNNVIIDKTNKQLRLYHKIISKQLAM